MAVLEQAFRIDPLHQTIRHNLVLNLVLEGNASRAREMVTPETELAYELKAIIAWREGRFADQSLALRRAIDLAEAGYDYRLSSMLAVTLFFRLHQLEEAREHASPTLRHFMTLLQDPEAAYAVASAIPDEQRGNAEENLLAYSAALLGRCEETLAVYAKRDYLNSPLWGDLRGSNNIQDASIYAWCLSESGRTDDARRLARRMEDYIDTAIANGQPPTYFSTLAEVQTLRGDHDAAIGSLKLAWQHYGLDWVDLASPILGPLRELPEFRELRAAVYAHTNTERARLGLVPVDMAALE